MSRAIRRIFLVLFVLAGFGAAAADANAASLRDRCDAGNAVACRELGYKYFNGEGVPQDPGRALILYEKACEGGDAEGCTAAGAGYGLGEVVERDYVQAFRYFNTACEGKHGAGCFAAGALFDHRKLRLNNNDPFYDEEDQAGYFYMKACDYGHAEGCNHFGVHRLRNGQEDLAPMSFRKACRGGSELGCQNLDDVCAGHTFPPTGCPRW